MIMTSKMIKAAAFAVATSVLSLAYGCSPEAKDDNSGAMLKTPEPKVSEVTVSGFRVDWTKVYGAEGYAYSLDGAEADTTDALFIKFNELEASNEYVVTIKAVPGKDSGLSESEPVYIHVHTSAVSPLDKPEITIGSTYASKTIISWSIVPGAVKYEYTVGDIKGSTTENKVSLSNLEKGKEYTFSVKAVAADNSGRTQSDAAQANFKTASDDVPPLLIVPENVLADAVVFNVYATPDATYYYDVVSSSTLMQYDEATVIERYKNAIVEYAKSKGISIRLAMASVLKVGTNTLSVSRLTSQMSYDIIAFGMDYDGNVTTGLFTKRVTTTATGWSAGPNYGGADWFRQNFFITNSYLGITGYGWTNSVWTTWKGSDVQSIRYRLLPTSTFNKVFSDPYDKEAIKTFLKDTSYSYAVKPNYLELVNSSNGYNSVTPCNPGVSYTMSALATSAAGAEELTVNSITTKTTSEAYTWFSIAALVNEKYGPTSSKMACVLKGVGIESGKLVIVKTSVLADVPESSYPALIADKGTELKESYLEYINGNGLALVVDVEPKTSYTVMATVVNKAGDKITKHASVTTTAEAGTKSARARNSVVFRNLAEKAEASPVGLRLDGVESIPVMDTPTAADDLWTIIHNINILGTNYEK